MILETDLTTLASVKAWLPVANTTTSADLVLTELISACSGDFLRAINRPDLLQATYTEVRRGDGGRRLVLYHWPIASITSLAVAGSSVPASSDRIEPGYYVDEDIDAERIFNLYMNGPYCFTDDAAIQIDYVAGYDAVPPDVQQAVNDWVAYRYKQLPNLGVTQRKLTEGESVQQSQADAPETTRGCIERYKRRVPSVSRRYDEEQAWSRVKAPKGARR